MTPVVYYGSPRQARLEGKETLPAKLDLIIDQLKIRERVKDETVAIKLHLGGELSYSVIHPIFVRKVVQAVKDGGGRPFVVDLGWNVRDAADRGYTPETLGCPVQNASGIRDQYAYSHHHPYKNIETWRVNGAMEDASFLINFAHIKGHPSCGFGGAIKNLALGGMDGKTRSAIHDTVHYEPYWFADKCPDRETFERILASCPMGALVEDREHPGNIHLHFEPCNQCGRCLQVAPAGSLKIDLANFAAFQEAMAISAGIVLSTFAPGKTVHLALATHMTPVCDCFGFTGMPILPDAGVFGSDDIVALDTAVLDVIGKTKLIEENVPTSHEVWCHEGHPFAQLHGPMKDPYLSGKYAAQIGLGSQEYEMVDVFPVETFSRPEITYIQTKE